MRIGIIGTGNMGRTLGLLWAESGHEVFFGHRDQAKAEAAARLAAAGAHAGTNDQAAEFGEVVFYGVRDVPPQEVLSSIRTLDGKSVIDCNNRDVPENYAFGPLFEESLAERLQAHLPDAHVVKAFNTLAMEVFEHAPNAIRQHGVSVFLSGNDDAAKATVTRLATELGFVPIDCGPLRSARLLEATGDFIRMLMGGMKRGPYATISVRDLPAVAAPRLGGRTQL